MLRVELLPGQTPAKWAERAEALRQVFRARRRQVREETSCSFWCRSLVRASDERRRRMGTGASCLRGRRADDDGLPR